MNGTVGTIFKSGKKPAASNMAFDAKILGELESYSVPILHLYDWQKDAITYGHFVQPERWLNLEFIQSHGIEFAKRPTGGGIVFHMCDFAFSIFVPRTFPTFSLNTLDNYAFVNRMVVRVVKRFLGEKLALLPIEPKPLDEASLHFCMAKPTKYDVIFEGKKVAGAAQRRTKAGFLHQGTIFLTHLRQEFLENLLIPHTKVAEGMQKHSFPLLGDIACLSILKEARETLHILFEEIFHHTFQEFSQCCV